MYYVYECEHLSKVFGCESGMGLGCHRATCKNCGGSFVIWRGTWGLFTRRADGQYYPGRALKTSDNWKALRQGLKDSRRTDEVVIFVRDKVVAVGEAPLAWWKREKNR